MTGPEHETIELWHPEVRLPESRRIEQPFGNQLGSYRAQLLSGLVEARRNVSGIL
jgi:hypothetical protein